MKKIAFSFFCCTIMCGSFAQTLFTYGKHVVSKDEFVRAFNKNPNLTTDRKKALLEYLDLYINFKLKVQAAYDDSLDKDATQLYELENFRRQVADNIINEEANVKELVKEAFNRSQKDIHLQQLFIEVPATADTLTAYSSIQAAYNALKQGKGFDETAKQYESNAGKTDLGYITVFTLPYNIESIVYGLKPGEFSQPYKTKFGYHIFRNMGERKPLGARRISQILIAMPPNASAEEKGVAKAKADSVYNLLAKGEKFDDIATRISNDLSSNHNKGELPEFTTGTYSADFENVVFALNGKGEMSKPFESAYGYHLIKLLEVKPVATSLDDPSVFSALQEKVSKDDRMESAKRLLIQKHLGLIKYKPSSTIKEKDLFVYTDSSLIKMEPITQKGINENSVIFSFAKQNVKAGDWVKYVKPATAANGSSRDYTKLYRDYINTTADEYYRSHLEDYNEDFSRQVKEFKEANLLFGVMEKNVWGKANNDTLGLQQYYAKNKAKYLWPASADAIIVTGNNLSIANAIKSRLKDSVSYWRDITSSLGNDVIADSGRFELTQLNVAGNKPEFVPGMETAPVKNSNEDTYTFNYIVKVHKEPGQRSFEDARGMVISDYQQVLEDKWIAELKRKYPVKVNDAVFKTVK